ncbi:acetyl-CoA synthetase-like protein [Sarocladium strictum]
MPISSRFTVDIPQCSVQSWILGPPAAPLPDYKAWIDPDDPSHFVTLSGARLLAKRIAIGLRQHGVQPGERVLIYSGNSIYFPVLVLGIWMAGCVFTGANPGFTARELAFQLRDSQASVMIAASQNGKPALEAAQACGMDVSRVFLMEHGKNHDSDSNDAQVRADDKLIMPRSWTHLIASEAHGHDFHWNEPKNSEATVCTLNYSSGTTGLPKGVEITHYNHVANSIAVERFDTLDPRTDIDASSKASLCVLPMYHAYCQLFYMCNLPRARTPVYVMPQFDFPKFLDHIKRYRITSVMAVPPILNLVAKHPLAKRADLSSLKSFGCGAAPLAGQTQDTVLGMLGSDAMVRQGWGMTELTSTGLVWDPRRQINTALGELIPGNQARLVDVDTGTEITDANTPGELWIASPTLMRGYWRNPQATASAISMDVNGTRWFRTGDIVKVDKYGPGALFFMVDRAKELIKVKGFQVAPAELEALLLERNDIVDAAVIGVVYDDKEVPRAYVVPAKKANTTAAELMAWVSERVARYKWLEGGVVFVESIPKNPAGKVLRNKLRDFARCDHELAKPHL